MCVYGNCRNEFLVMINGYVEFNPTVRGLSVFFLAVLLGRFIGKFTMQPFAVQLLLSHWLNPLTGKAGYIRLGGGACLQKFAVTALNEFCSI